MYTLYAEPGGSREPPGLIEPRGQLPRCTPVSEATAQGAAEVHLAGTQVSGGVACTDHSMREDGPTLSAGARLAPQGPKEQQLSLLLDLSAMLAREVALDALVSTIGARVARALHAERATLYLLDAASGELRSRVADLPEMPEIRLPPGRGVAGYVAATGQLVNLRDAAQDPRHWREVDRATGFRTRSMLCAPIREPGKAIRGVLQVLNREGGWFEAEDEAFLQALAGQVALALNRTSLRPEPGDKPGVRLRGPYNHIIGSSAPMHRVYEQIMRAAATDATVLLRGQTGVGKGLFARAIHANCRRRSGPFVTVDCTTLPLELVENELFGHERGAYTGADRQVEGKVEQAAGGTLFLDEVAELPKAAQARLLRFLQERCFERVGGRKTLAVDVRIIAATHQDLESLVARGLLRSDLLYRLKVVEIEVPSLLERGAQEVLTLAHHFLEVYSQRHGREHLRLSLEAEAALQAHTWPGNVRELEHALERAVVLCPGELVGPELLGLGASRRGATAVAPLLQAVTGTEGRYLQPVSGLGLSSAGSGVGEGRLEGAEGPGVLLPFGLALEEVERRYVAATLRAHGGNQTQAARALGVGRNTLRRKVA